MANRNLAIDDGFRKYVLSCDVLILGTYIQLQKAQAGEHQKYSLS